MGQSFHKWIATIVLIGSFAWGGLAYYVTTQVALTELRLQTEIKGVSSRVDVLSVTITEMKDLREAISNLRVELAGERK